MKNSIETFVRHLTISERINFWKDYDYIVHSATYANPLTLYMDKQLNEGLIRTYPIEKTIDFVKSYFNFNEKQIQVVPVANGEKNIIIYLPVIGNNIDQVTKAMNLCGYFLSHKVFKVLPLGKVATLQFEARNQKDISKELRNEEKTLLHITPKYNVNKIKNIGFSPRHRNELFNFPERIYFLRGTVLKDAIMDIGDQLNYSNTSPGNNGEYALFTIDLAKVSEDVKWFVDPNYPHGVYTTQNISPNTIINYETIKFVK